MILMIFSNRNDSVIYHPERWPPRSPAPRLPPWSVERAQHLNSSSWAKGASRGHHAWWQKQSMGLWLRHRTFEHLNLGETSPRQIWTIRSNILLFPAFAPLCTPAKPPTVINWSRLHKCDAPAFNPPLKSRANLIAEQRQIDSWTCTCWV